MAFLFRKKDKDKDRPASPGGNNAASPKDSTSPKGKDKDKEKEKEKKKKEDPNAVKCKQCGEAITDCILQIQGENWHESCFVCGECKKPIADALYVVRNDTPHCQACDKAIEQRNQKKTSWKEKQYGPVIGQCTLCGKDCHEGGPIMAANKKLFHVTCFICTRCKKDVRDGFQMREDRLFCPTCAYVPVALNLGKRTVEVNSMSPKLVTTPATEEVDEQGNVKFCPSCRARNVRSGGKFCISCGFKYVQSPSASPSAASSSTS